MQDEVFQRVGKPITDTCLAGYNGTIFAYGQVHSKILRHSLNHFFKT